MAADSTASVVVAVAVVRGDEVLLARHRYHADKRPALIAGHVEAGESVEEAAVREVREETGLEVVVGRLLGEWEMGDGEYRLVGCEARLAGGAFRLSDELEDARWHRLGAVPDWPPDHPVARILDRVVQQS